MNKAISYALAVMMMLTIGQLIALDSAPSRPAGSADPLDMSGSDGKPKKIYVCPVADCGQKLGDSSNFNRHLRQSHAGTSIPGYDYQCSDCQPSVSFTTERSLTLHRGQKHPTACNRPFNCRMAGCQQRFAHVSNRNAHEKKQHANKQHARILAGSRITPKKPALPTVAALTLIRPMPTTAPAPIPVVPTALLMLADAAAGIVTPVLPDCSPLATEAITIALAAENPLNTTGAAALTGSTPERTPARKRTADIATVSA
ncbi:MAG TPA: C2H2-type zinc finger protein, partial [Candidatus Babeliales bacterium]|nr:C2H2-type zinc finger protein [Candidatus Babeliales bacterium]